MSNQPIAIATKIPAYDRDAAIAEAQAKVTELEAKLAAAQADTTYNRQYLISLAEKPLRYAQMALSNAKDPAGKKSSPECYRIDVSNSYEVREQLKAAGYKWDGAAKVWTKIIARKEDIAAELPVLKAINAQLRG